MRTKFIAAMVLAAFSSAHAQFTANQRTNVVSGVTSNWNGDYLVGSNTFKDVLQVVNAGVLNLTNGHSYLGYAVNASNNLAIVSGTGSIWSNSATVYVGYSGAQNSVTISNRGVVVADPTMNWVGYNSSSSNNSVLVTGAGSVWNGALSVGGGAGNSLVVSNAGLVNGKSVLGSEISSSNNSILVTGTNSIWRGSLTVGSGGRNNRLVISSGAAAISDSSGELGDAVSSSSNSAVVSGTGSTWSNNFDLVIGDSGAGNSLVISNGGALANANGHVGGSFCFTCGGKNSVVVADPGSMWRNDNILYFGYSSSGNNLVISNGGLVVNGACFIGSDPSSSNNAVRVIGAGSVLSNGGNLIVGNSGPANSLTITNGAAVFSGGSTVGSSPSSSNNLVMVTGVGSVWSNTSDLYFGSFGAANRLVLSDHAGLFCDVSYVGLSASSNSNDVRVADSAIWQNNVLYFGGGSTSNTLIVAGGSVMATNLVVGVESSSCNNLVRLDSGFLIVTNATHDAVLEVRNGKLIMNGGTLRVDQFVMTNACAQFLRTAGTFSYGMAVLDPNTSAVGDGIPNGWKQHYGFDAFDPNLAAIDSDGDGFSNLQEYQSSFSPINNSAYLRIISIRKTNNNINVTYLGANGDSTWSPGTLSRTNVLEFASSITGGYTNNFIPTGQTNILSGGTGVGVITNMVDAGGATNFPSRYYRVRVLP